MTNSILKQHILRFAQVIFTIWFAITLSFGLIRLMPGGPVDYLRSELALSGVSMDVLHAQVEKYTNLQPDAPLLDQYFNYISSILQGELGQSVWYDEPVADIVFEALPWTLLLVVTSLFFIYLIGIVGGAVMAYTEGSKFDNRFSALAIFLNSIPSYVAAVVFLFFLAFQQGWFPTQGRMDTATEVGLNLPFIAGVLHHLALPVAAFVITNFGFRALTMRGNSISVLGEEFVRVARLRGLPSRIIALRYVGRNAVLPLYTGLLMAVGQLMGLTIIIEEIFGYRGIGFYMLRGIQARDYPLIMGCFIVITVTVVLGTYVADLTYRFVDPRTDARNETPNIEMRELWNGLKAPFKRLRQRLSGSAKSAQTDLGLSEKRDKIASTQFGGDASQYDLDGGESTFHNFVVVPFKIIWGDWRTRIGLTIISFYVVVGVIGPLLLPAPDSGQGPQQLQAFQTLAHPFGTDDAGRDLLSLLVYATRPMLVMILVGAGFATIVASIVGIIAGYAGGFIDRILSTLSDVVIAIPGIPLAIVLGSLFQPTNPAIIGLIITINAWGGTARQIRSETLSVRENHYVEASQVMGVSTFRLLYKEVLPNILSFILIKFVSTARLVVFASVGLYFIGALPYTLEHWGVVMQLAYDAGAIFIPSIAYWLFIPMAVIVVLNYGFVLFAQGTDRLLNPRIRAKHKKQQTMDSGSQATVHSTQDAGQD